MIKTLQKKFIITAMVAISVLLLVLLGAINGVNYWMVSQQAERTLMMLSENEGGFPPQMEQQKKGRPSLFGSPFLRDTAMSARYFVVGLDTVGNVLQTDVSRIASITETEAEVFAQKAYERGDVSGSIDQFKYKITPPHDGKGSVIIFLDTSIQLYSILMVLVNSFCIGIICWILMLLLVIFLSKKAILPIARNIEKQKQFITNAGHEIKTPLAIILANTDAMELHNGENKWSRNIRAQTTRLSGLMENLLILAKMDENGRSFPASDFSVSLLLEETLNLFYESAALSGVTIQKDIQPKVILHGNRDNMMQLISILMDNAVKYTNPNGRITVSLQKSERAVILQMKNTCMKLPEGDLEKLFDRFFRGDSARTQKSGGYGIGLSVARAIAEAHKGSITAGYENENTITFTVKL